MKPPTTFPLFDAIASREAATCGIELAANNNASNVVKAREMAVSIARETGTVNADSLLRRGCEQGGGIHDLGNSCGAVFRDRRLEWTGQFTKSERIHARANLLRVWRLATQSR